MWEQAGFPVCSRTTAVDEIDRMDEFSLIFIFRVSLGCALIWPDSEIIENSLATYDASAPQNIGCFRNLDAINRWEFYLSHAFNF